MDDPVRTEEKPLTPIQNVGGCAILLGVALGLFAAFLNGYGRHVGQRWASPEVKWLWGAAAVLGALGILIAALTMPRGEPGSPKTWRQAAMESAMYTPFYAAGGFLIAWLNRDLPAFWVGVAYLLALFAVGTLARRSPFGSWRRRNVDPEAPEPLQ